MQDYTPNLLELFKSKTIKLVLLSIFAGFYDWFIRTSDAYWTSLPPFQWVVTFSPLIYLLALIYLLLFLSPLPQRLSKKKIEYLNALLFTYCVFIIYQIFTKEISVGSARYSIILPLYFSGIPAAIMTFLVYFKQKKSLPNSVVVSIACLLWVFGTFAFDYEYSQFGGYRGVNPLFDFPVISTSFWLIQNSLTYFFLISIFLSPVFLVFAFKKIYTTEPSQRLNTSLVIFSFITLYLQIYNWASFQMD